MAFTEVLDLLGTKHHSHCSSQACRSPRIAAAEAGQAAGPRRPGNIPIAQVVAEADMLRRVAGGAAVGTAARSRSGSLGTRDVKAG